MSNYPYSKNDDIQTKFLSIVDNGKKNYYTYILLDPRILNNLQKRSQKPTKLSNKDIISQFVKSIFYIGKGTKLRSNSHIVETFKKSGKGQKLSEKEEKIQTILNTPINDDPNAQK